MPETIEKIREIWAREMELPIEAVTADTRLREARERRNPSMSRDSVDAPDSLDFVEFIMSVEEEFDVELPDFVCAGCDTLQDLAHQVDRRRA